MRQRRRLARPVRLRGRALFGGGTSTVTLRPGQRGAGWRWAVGNLPHEPMEPRHHSPLPRRSSLEGAATADLCEHVLAALVLADIDDCDLRFHDGEAPILDGSSAPWLQAIAASGVRGGKHRGGLKVRVTWRDQEVCWSGDTRIGRARTFLTTREGALLEKRGAFPGARPGCALVLSPDGRSARYGGRPRMPAEPAWHKLLDVLGDLGPWRARGAIHGLLELSEPGHSHNGKAIEAAFASGQLTFEP